MNTTDLQTIPTDVIATDDVYAQERTYPLEEMIKLRYKHNMSINQIADKMGCHKVTVFRKLQKYLKLLPNPEEIENYRQNKTTLLDGLELKVYEEMSNPEKLKDASFNNLAYGFQNISTQNRLEKGLATARIDSVSITASLSELDKRKADLLRSIKVQDVVSDTTSNKS